MLASIVLSLSRVLYGYCEALLCGRNIFVFLFEVTLKQNLILATLLMDHTHFIAHTHTHRLHFFIFYLLIMVLTKFRLLHQMPALQKKRDTQNNTNTLTHLKYLHNYKRTQQYCV